MLRLIVKADHLNRRKSIPITLPDTKNIIDVVKKGFTFDGDLATTLSNGDKWYKDPLDRFYWGGGVAILEDPDVHFISPGIKSKIEQVINAFETGTATGNYSTLVKLKDYRDPATNTRITQVTYGRSQTTEFGNLKILVKDYVDREGLHAGTLRSYINRIGKKPSLATDAVFCNTLRKAGKEDPVMKLCQDHLFDTQYYKPAYKWFIDNGFSLPLSLLVIYDSKLHSGSILPFLRKRFATPVPVKGGDEMEWIVNYVSARHHWLANHRDKLLKKTIYRTQCLKEQIKKENWQMENKIKANGILID